MHDRGRSSHQLLLTLVDSQTGSISGVYELKTRTECKRISLWSVVHQQLKRESLFEVLVFLSQNMISRPVTNDLSELEAEINLLQGYKSFFVRMLASTREVIAIYMVT